MPMPKAALLRAISDEIPVTLLDKLTTTYISPEDIETAARTAITGVEGESDSTGFAGINRYMFFGGGNNAFIDPGGKLVQGTRDHVLSVRRARGADPAGMKVRTRTMAQKQKAQQQPTGAS